MVSRSAAVLLCVAALSWAGGCVREGCWVEIYEDEHFSRADSWDVIHGPGRWSDLRRLPGAYKRDWGDRIDSLVVGPHARVILWKDRDFEDDFRMFGPGDRVPELDDLDFEDEAESMKIEYVP